MVDEFQDIDGLQHELMEVLAGYHKNLFVVATRTRPSIPGGELM